MCTREIKLKLCVNKKNKQWEENIGCDMIGELAYEAPVAEHLGATKLLIFSFFILLLPD